MRRARSVLAALLLGAVLLPVAAGAQDASQQQTRDELGITVATGFDGRSREGSWQPVAVGLEPIRPVAGTLSVTASDTRTSETLAVEVAAGSRKVYRFVVPAGRIEVTFAQDGAEPLTVRPGSDPVTGEYLVGLLGDGADNLPPLRSEFTGRSGAWVVVDPAWLDVSAQAVEPLGALVATAADLQALAPPAAANLVSAVTGGTDLIVVGGNAAVLGALGLPERAQSWQVTAADLEDAPGAGGAALASAVTVGAGRVVTTDVAPGDAGLGRSQEFWSLLAQPAVRPPASQADHRVTTTPHQFSRLLADASAEAPTLPGLGAFVLIYVLVVGPVNGIVLARMGRRELAWVTVPVVTAVFTIGAFVGATAARPESGGLSRLTYWLDGAATEFIAAGVRAPTPGTRSLTLPGGGWTVRPLVDGGNGAAISRSSDVTVSMELTALQLGGVAAWRPSAEPAPLEVQARAGADGLEVTVRNTSGRRIEDVTARVATTSRSLGTLEAGASDSVTMAVSRLGSSSAYGDPFEGLLLDRNGAVAAPLSMRAVLNTEVIQGRPGTVWVSGVTDAPAPGVTSGGQALRDRGSMVAVGAAVAPGGRPLSPFAVARDAIFDPSQTYPIGSNAVEGDGELFLRFRLPVGAAASQLANQLERSAQTGGNPQLTVWDVDRRQWIDVDEGFANPQRLVGPLGEVWVRASGQMFPFEFAGRTIAGRTP